MPTWVLALLLGAVLGFLPDRGQQRLRKVLHNKPAWIWAVPVLLTLIFSGAAALADAWTPALAFLVLPYTAAPVACAWVAGVGPTHRPAGLDFAAILLLWLPLELAAGARLIPRPTQGFLHSVAYGISILLALLLFLCFRSLSGMKFGLPHGWRDAWLPLAAFAAVAPVLAVLGILLDFIPAPHLPRQGAVSMAAGVGVIFAGTALPEEILFRSLIQSLLMQRFGATWRTLLAASLVFGCAHLNNGPQALPNWRYMILATLAGLAYGMVFQRTSTVLSSAALHMLVDWTKHFFF